MYSNASSSSRDDLPFRARVTQNQLAALAVRMDERKVLTELSSLPYLAKLKVCKTYDPSTVAPLLRNGWNTELLLRANLERLDGDVLGASLHWAFPQAYYSVFSVCLAYFRVVGRTESSHASVLHKVGTMMAKGNYPPAVSFVAGGGRDRQYINIEMTNRGLVINQAALRKALSPTRNSAPTW